MRLIDIRRRSHNLSISAPAYFGAHKLSLGVNMPSYPYYGHDPGPTNLFWSKTAPQGIGGGAVSFDSDGWPTTDFRTLFYPGPQPSPAITITVQCTGIIGSITWAFQRGGSNLSPMSYDSGLNQTTFTFTYDPSVPSGDLSPMLNFNNTQRDPGSPINTGVANIFMWEPAYVGNTTQVWTNELSTAIADFSVLRTMDMQSINNDVTTTDWDPVHETSLNIASPASVRSIIALANEQGKDLWMQIPTNATADWDNNFFAYILANLNSARKLYFGFSNETWNFSFQQFFVFLKSAAIEVQGAVGGLATRKLLSIVGDGTTTTLTLDYTTDLSVGGHISTSNFPSGAQGNNFVITAVGTNTISYSSAYNGSVSQPSTSMWFINSDSTSNLRGPENTTNLYSINSRWCYRRLVQASDRCRAIVGDSAMMTRFRPVLEDQMINNSGMGELSYISFLAGGDSLVKTKVYALAGAPYFGTNGSLAGGANLIGDMTAHTQADYLTAFQLDSSTAKTRYQFDQRTATALFYGIKNFCYEGGPDVANDVGTSNVMTRNASKLSPGFKPIYAAYLQDLGASGLDLFCHFNLGAFAATSTSIYTWGFTDGYTNVTGFWQSFKDYNATDASALPQRNMLAGSIGVPTVVDGRLHIGRFDTSGVYDGLRTTKNVYAFIITVPVAGTYSFKFSYSSVYLVGDSWNIQVNGVNVSSFTHTMTSDLTTYQDSPTFTLTLPAGIVSVGFAGNGGGGSDNEKIFSATFVRTA